METGYRGQDLIPRKNLRILLKDNSFFQAYNSETPPFYDWSKIDLPVHLFVGTSDWISTPEDVLLIRPYLKNSTLEMIDDFDHLDFIWGKTAHLELHPKIINVLKSSKL